MVHGHVGRCLPSLRAPEVVLWASAVGAGHLAVGLNAEPPGRCAEPPCAALRRWLKLFSPARGPSMPAAPCHHQPALNGRHCPREKGSRAAGSERAGAAGKGRGGRGGRGDGWGLGLGEALGWLGADHGEKSAGFCTSEPRWGMSSSRKLKASPGNLLFP